MYEAWIIWSILSAAGLAQGIAIKALIIYVANVLASAVPAICP